MKLIQQMMDSLFLLLNKKDIDDAQRQIELEKFYKDYLGETRDFYTKSSLEDTISYLKEKYGDEDLFFRLQMLSEIMYQDGMLESEERTKELKLLKTLPLLDYLEEYSNTYSLVRVGKIEELNALLK